MSVSPETEAILRDLARRPANHDNIKATFKELLVREFGVERGALDFEVRAPVIAGRLDALVGRTIFEAKRDLLAEWSDVERRMPDYLADREREFGEPFVGIASDGYRWVALELREGSLQRITETTLVPEKGEAFLAWLDGVVALKAGLPTDSLTVRAELGQESVAFRRVDRELRAAWDRLKDDPAQALKRQLWADLLKLVYGREVQSDALWFQHTYLVIVAKCVALAVMALHEDDPERMLSGQAFADAGIHGAVESDFFDWVIADPEGEALVRRVMAHVRRFRLHEVESDVLKILYESLIDRDERHGLGEYYTPDWLAAKIVRHSVNDPVAQRVLDPACGSGTFLFHAVRRFLAEAEEGGMARPDRAAEACSHVAGLDIHPVAVIIARVTYLLALAPALVGRVGSLSIPVWLGDAMQLSINPMGQFKELVIQVPPPPSGEGSRERLSFPETFCRDPALFDKAIEAMRDGSERDRSRDEVQADLERRTQEHHKRDLTPEEGIAIGDLGATYETFHKLRLEGRDTIWSYVARNLSRPLALAGGGGWAHVVVGNPPWVAFRHMSADLQTRFRELSVPEGIYSGNALSHNDICALFVVRSAQLYLRPNGRLAFVLPFAVFSRNQFRRLRTGKFQSVKIAWDEGWTMDERVGPLFPRPSGVLFGRKRGTAGPVPNEVTEFIGRLPFRDASEAVAADYLQQVKVTAPPAAIRTGGSPYRNAFRQGAVLIPRMLTLVERASLGRLGPDERAPLVESGRTSDEKEPWKNVPSVKGPIEVDFLFPVLLGASVAPYRLLEPVEAAIPILPDGTLLTEKAAASLGLTHAAAWIGQAERVFRSHGKGKRTFIEQLDYIKQLSSQFPLRPLRVVYTKAGNRAAATIVRDAKYVIDQKLYWAPASSEAEAQYLAALANSESVRNRIAEYQSRGLFGTQDFDKVMFNLPIPLFDPENPLHGDIARAGARAEEVAGMVDLVEGEKFQRARKRVREALAQEGVGGEIEKLVEKLLDG